MREGACSASLFVLTKGLCMHTASRKQVAESARGHSYSFSSEVQTTVEFWLLTFWLLLLPLFYTSIAKMCSLHSMQCQNVSS